MDRISLTGIQAFGHHGVLPHERRFGQRFVVDLHLDVDLAPAGASDDLADTVDYGALAAAVVEVVAGEPVDLIETVAARIAERALAPGLVTAVEVTVHKPAAPVPVLADEVAVTIRRQRA